MHKVELSQQATIKTYTTNISHTWPEIPII